MPHTVDSIRTQLTSDVQLLNRNPQNRLGAKRGAAELKEHPFFSAINWDLLYRKQITPPFKPIVDSDESVANFDPEFTNSSLSDAGIQPWDEDEAEVPLGQNVRHSYLGPGGSLKDPAGQHMSGASATAAAESGASAAGAKQIAMPINKGQGKNGIQGGGSPLTSSLQENFRGFTYTGESLMVSLSPNQASAQR